MSFPVVATSVPWLSTGTEFFLEQLDRCELTAASGLPGWRNGHVAAHVARNADALLRLLHWANTGEQTLMYASAEARSAEIERDAGREAAVQRADVRATAAALDDAIAATPDEVWAVQIRSTRRAIAAGEVPWMRAKEVWLHAVDIGGSPDRIPSDMATALFDELAETFAGREDVPVVQLVDSGSGRSVEIGDGGPRVSGSARDLATWLSGRSTGDRLHCPSGLPVLPPWL